VGLFSDVWGQNIPSKGTLRTLEIATWNLEWFGHPSNGPTDDALQAKQVRQVIAASNIDLFGVQEVSDATEFNQVLAELGTNYAGKYLVTTTTGGEQHLGFIYKKDVVEVQSIEPFMTADAYYFGSRAPILMKATIHISGQTFPILVINFHAKAFADATSYTRRKDAATRLKAYLDATYPNDRIVILGDYNDLFVGSILTTETNSPYKVFVDDTQNYKALNTPCSFYAPTYCSAIDHIILSNDLNAQFVSFTTYEELRTTIPDYHNTTTDHIPVIATFNAPIALAAEDEVPKKPSLLTMYPNPFATNTTLEVQNDESGMATLSVFDVLGRKIQTIHQGFLTSGTHRFVLNASNLPNGAYFVSLQTTQQNSVQLLTLFR
jgi:endonuclease/exonuclease/phosphatase family metal-dependent hydrolase